MLPDIAEYEITDIKVDEHSIPVWIEFEYEGIKHRTGVYDPPFSLQEVKDIGLNKDMYLGGKVTVRKRDRRIYEAIIVTANPTYVSPHVRGIDRKDVWNTFKHIQ